MLQYTTPQKRVRFNMIIITIIGWTIYCSVLGINMDLTGFNTFEGVINSFSQLQGFLGLYIKIQLFVKPLIIVHAFFVAGSYLSV